MLRFFSVTATPFIHEDPEVGIHGLGRLTDAELCWVYRNAAVVVGAGREDFGLTVVEAALEGTPAATVPTGGYLATVRPGVSGAYAASATPNDLSRAIAQVRELDPAACREWRHGFRRATHVVRLATVLQEVETQG